MGVFNNALKEYFRTLHHKRSIRAITTASILLGLPILGAYAYFMAVKRIRVDHVPIVLDNPHSNLKGLRIAQISDLHFGPTNSGENHFHKAVDLINAQNPDLVVLTGDYYQWDPSFLYELPKILARIRAPLGVYGCLGNHDYGSCYPGELRNDPFEYHIIKAAFERNNIQILANETQKLQYKGENFNLVGLHDLWSGYFEPEKTFEAVDNTLPTIVLSHNPDTYLMVKPEFDLMLSGHSHGGQVSWPIVGPVAIPMKNKDLRRGHHKRSERKQLYVNRGLGHTFRMRLNSPPEVTLLEIL